ncbi:type IV pilin [Natrononativus amylolyticus]|uniref:type IV pilin n=1 Tax=Natrononativus amylolyticus TaxID=2963434 RepID=UPI0020CC5779|nr:type IV pilin N-terminal domain-containing protein [Natrononativus amylolyticus]
MNFAKKLIGNEEERAVSPVIGVILMVAITVILAAVIAAFVLDIGSTSQPPQASFSVSQGVDDGDDVHIQVSSAQRLDAVEVASTDCDATLSGLDAASDPGVGDSGTVGEGATDCDAGHQIDIIGVYDGESTIIQSFELDHDLSTA